MQHSILVSTSLAETVSFRPTQVSPFNSIGHVVFVRFLVGQIRMVESAIYSTISFHVSETRFCSLV